MGVGLGKSFLLRIHFIRVGGEVQSVNLFLQRIQICKKWRGRGLEYVIFLKESKSKKMWVGGEGALVSDFFTNNLNLNKKKKWGGGGAGGWGARESFF